MAKETEETADQQTPQAEEIKNIVSIEDAGPCKKKVSVEIPAEKIEKMTDEQYGELLKQVDVPGFRKGRAPRRLLEKRFGKETSEQVKLKLLAEASDSAIKDNELNIIGEPNIDYEKIALPAEGPMKFEFEVEVRPEFELPSLEGIPVEKTKMEVTGEQVDAEIDSIRRYLGIWTPRREDESVESDDQVIADVVLKIEGVEEEEKLDNTEIYVRDNSFVGPIPIENLSELLVAAKTGDTVETTIETPKTFFNEQYRDKKISVKIEIKDIKYLKMAALDENLLAGLGVESEDELKRHLTDRLSARLERQVRLSMVEQVYKYMLAHTSFELPADVAAGYSLTLLKRQYANLLSSGLPREQIQEQLEQLKAGSEQEANRQLKTFFIMDKVADKLGIEVGDEELNGQIAQLAIEQGQRPEKLRQEMEKNGSLEQFRQQVRDEKCVEKILESAKVKEVEPKKETEKPKKPTKKEKEEEPKKTAKKAEKAPVKKTEKKEPSDKTTAKKQKKATKKKTDK